MSQKQLLIIHTKKSLEIDQKDISYINLGSAISNVPGAKKLILLKYRKIYYEKYKKLLIKELTTKAKESKKKISFINELELFNLRNDKNTNIDLILNILIIGEIIKIENFSNISLVTDNFLVKSIFAQTYPFIKINYKVDNKIKDKFVLPKIIKFYVKTLFLIIFIKIFINNRVRLKKFNKACLSMYPIFYKNNKEKFFNDKNKIKFNFLLSDETHLNLSFFKIIKVLKEIKNNETIHVESFITIKSLIKAFIKSIIYYFVSLKLNFRFRLNNLDLSSFYKNYIYTSLLNRYKLNIYEEPFIKALKKFDIKQFDMYLFEYNFGFFLNNLIKKKTNNIKIVGYQHGIFSNQLLWLDILLKDKNKFNYLPDEIKSFNINSFKDYRSKINSNKIKFNLLSKNKSNLVSEYKHSKRKQFSKDILVLPGTHDADDIYHAIKGKNLNNKNKDTFFIKFHPKKTLKIKNTKKLKIIKSIRNKKFSTVLISATSTLVYDFMNSKKNFMVYNIDNKQDLISTKLNNKIKLYYF
ncbi:hypothetical protein N9S39_03710 [Candidatus Pelagibacter sp.]|nr:hypothetical protein [Candidatus Pelagibacter sp.]